MKLEHDLRRAPNPAARLGQLGLWLVMKSGLFLVGALRWCTTGPHRRDRQVRLAIESGARGWELIEYEEIYHSAREYLGATRVGQVIIQDRANYLRDVRVALRTTRPTHYFYDPRTGSQGALRGLWQATVAAVLFRWYQVTPIAWLTDLPIRGWRRQCWVVTAHSGVIVTLMSPPHVSAFIPHARLTGPSLMAISGERLNALHRGRSARQPGEPRAVFTGSIYEPRATILTEIQDLLHAEGWDLDLQVRTLDGQRAPNEEYWARLYRADILVTTADQVVGKGIDVVGLPHLIFRYSEALAAGTLLVAPEVPGIRRYFVPGVHFATYSTPKEAAEVIAYYLSQPKERQAIAAAGAERMMQLIRSRAYWLAIDSALGKQSMTY